MKVRCPKCRLSFDVTALPGITEVACNCPRCGTPFTYSVGEEASQRQPTDAAENTQRAATTPEEKPSSGSEPQSAPTPPPPPHATTESSPASHRSQGSVPPPHFTGNTIPPQPPTGLGEHHNSCLRTLIMCVLVLALGALGITILVNRCSDNIDSSYSESAGGDMVTTVAADTTSAMADVTTSEDDAKGAPSWIEGTWTYDDSGPDGLGKVEVVIRGNHLQEIIEGMDAASGTFTYSGGALHFLSDNGDSRCQYNLDTRNHRIEWQDNKFMEKEY